jgi:GT2 family glycosyltransferase
MGPRISIGMPCYNSERWISPAIESLLAQSFEDFELIVSDNASSDGTWDIVQRYAAGDDRIRPYRNPENLGASANFNRVFELARAPYFKWASSNDWCAPGLLDACRNALDADPGAVLACPRAGMFTAVPGDGPDYPFGLDLRQGEPAERFVGSLAIRRNIPMNGLIRSTALRRTELIRPYYGSDLVMISALALQGKLLELPQTLLFMRDTSETSTARMGADAVRRHYAPKSARRMTNQSLRNWLGYWRAVRDADLPVRQRLKLIGHLAKMARWRSRDVFAEAIDSMRGAWSGEAVPDSAQGGGSGGPGRLDR